VACQVAGLVVVRRGLPTKESGPDSERIPVRLLRAPAVRLLGDSSLMSLRARESEPSTGEPLHWRQSDNICDGREGWARERRGIKRRPVALPSLDWEACDSIRICRPSPTQEQFKISSDYSKSSLKQTSQHFPTKTWLLLSPQTSASKVGFPLVFILECLATELTRQIRLARSERRRVRVGRQLRLQGLGSSAEVHRPDSAGKLPLRPLLIVSRSNPLSF
jgi:hypothetical protein